MSSPRQGTDTLAPGLQVDAYVIKSVLGAGGFGVTYLAEHRRLGKSFAMKEYYPRAFAVRDGTDVIARTKAEGTYQWGLDRFMQEARALARFHHPAIVQVSNVFEANGTAYMVLSFEEGRDMRDWLQELNRPPTQAELDVIVAPLLDALSLLHTEGLLHRDIAPDNIYIRRNGSPVLLDFGAARGALLQQSQQMSAIVKTGYSPPEQYHTKATAQGPWSDIYAFGATLYWAVTGQLPPESTERTLSDTYVSATKMARGNFRQGFLQGIDDALRVAPDTRPRTIDEWRTNLLSGSAETATATASPFAGGQSRRVTGATAVDLGPGSGTRHLMAVQQPSRWLAVAAAVLVLGGGLVYVLRPAVPLPGTIAGASGAVATCDRATSIPGDPRARADAVNLEDLDVGAVSACRSALAGAGPADRPRLEAQLARLLIATGDIAAAYQAAQSSSAAGYAEGASLLADLMWAGQPPAPSNMGEACRLYDVAAASGSTSGTDAWAICLLHGMGNTPRDAARAAEMARALAERGDRRGYMTYAYMLREGDGTPKDPAAAVSWYEKAVTAGSAPAMVALGMMVREGLGTARDDQRANDLFGRSLPILKRLVDRNDANAMSWLGDLYANGWGVTQDLTEAARLYRMAGERGALYGMVDYGNMLVDGRGVAANGHEAMHWFRRAAERGYARGMVNLGLLLDEGKVVEQDMKEALAWYRKAAELGNVDGITNVGYMYDNGRGVTRNSAEAAKWFRRAAELGGTNAIYNLGWITEHGRGVQQDLAEAARLYASAAERGHVDAMVALGVLYETGRGAPASYAVALEWYRRAAEQGNAIAMHNIGGLYENGRGVAKDCGAALSWFRRAAEAGDADSAKRVQELSRKRIC